MLFHTESLFFKARGNHVFQVGISCSCVGNDIKYVAELATLEGEIPGYLMAPLYETLTKLRFLMREEGDRQGGEGPSASSPP